MERLVDSLQIRQEEEIKDLQDELKMLQTLATTGIVTNMFMHEIRTLTNNIGQELDAAYEAIKIMIEILMRHLQILSKP